MTAQTMQRQPYMTNATTLHRFPLVRLRPLDTFILFALMLGSIAVATSHIPSRDMAVPLAGRMPALQVAVTPRVGLSPLTTRVIVRQELAKVRGSEVCLVVAYDPDQTHDNISCWTSNDPTATVERTFALVAAGRYRVWAQVGNERSNAVSVEVTRAHN